MKPEASVLITKKLKKLEGEGRAAEMSGDSTFDRIWKYYHDSKKKIVLTHEQEQIRERWEKAWFLMFEKNSQKEVAQLLKGLFPISISTAFADIRNAISLFSNPQQNMKEAKRLIAEEGILKIIKLAEEKGDFDTAQKGWEKYIKLNQLDKPDVANADELRKQVPAQVIIVAKETELKKMVQDMQEKLADDIEYEEG
jgi:hypothetical protein